MSFKRGDLVEPTIESGFHLRSGGSYYRCAVVVRANPFVLVSTQGDMRWGYTIKPEDFQKIGEASPDTLAICMERLEK